MGYYYTRAVLELIQSSAQENNQKKEKKMLTLKVIGTLWDVADDCPSTYKFEGPTVKIFEGERIDYGWFVPQSERERGDWLLDDDSDDTRCSYGFENWKKGKVAIFDITLNSKESRVSLFGDFDAYVMNERGSTIEAIRNRTSER